MLPALREDISLHEGPLEDNGAQSWMLHDPVTNRYYKISWVGLEVLSRWALGNADAITKAVNQETPLSITEEHVGAVAQMLMKNSLVQCHHAKASKHLLSLYEKSRSSWTQWALHHYLFFRIPLINPDGFLEKTCGIGHFIFSRFFNVLSCLACLIGLVLLVPRWDEFGATFIDTMSWQGLAGYGLTYLVVKVVHEFGHGYALKLSGKRVPAMGVAFLVLWPVLYTDTNQSWEVKSKKQKLNIAFAGIQTELVIAAWATLVWNLLPEGGLKSSAFLLATVTWVSSFALNLSPFMRFDGYFLLMDGLGIHNLHERSFALARWKIRTWLLASQEAPPEKFSSTTQKGLILFAFLTWLYRLFLFLGIAFMVYHFFIKLVGIFLFAVEIIWFILKPIWKEITMWHHQRDILFTYRAKIRMAVIISGLCLFLVIPWQTSQNIPALLETDSFTSHYAPVSGQLIKLNVTEGLEVKQGDVLAVFNSPEIETELSKLHAKIEHLKQERNTAQIDTRQSARRATLDQQINELSLKLNGLEKKKERTSILSTEQGVITDLDTDLQEGQWIKEKDFLFSLRAKEKAKVSAYIEEHFIYQIKKQETAIFYADDPAHKPLPCQIKQIDHSAIISLNKPLLASTYGGPIATRIHEERLIPNTATYQLHCIPLNQDKPIRREITGRLHVKTEPESLFTQGWTIIINTLIRESGM
ncbi:biotin/lipoyl-binding protein [Terasakiella sp. SH-1]|uniref:efflux RND transporter periplasmic adaptor subunit n=1 Tax=Terasakiella sp. SH-1 TaxID=2560057 RepID=UPI0010730DC0|nr:biotin/lipoyl-binding protein [Terasakiella sp. SH-1]